MIKLHNISIDFDISFPEFASETIKSCPYIRYVLYVPAKHIINYSSQKLCIISFRITISHDLRKYHIGLSIDTLLNYLLNEQRQIEVLFLNFH